MINKKQVSQKFGLAVQTYAEEAVAQQHIALKMTELLKKHLQKTFPRKVLELGCGTGYFSRQLIQLYGEEALILNDICPEMLHYCREHIGGHLKQIPGDAEKIELPKHTSLITSCSALQWFENPSLFFENCLSSLSRDGFLAFSTFGPENLYEVKDLTGRGLTYPSLNELKRMLEQHYDICHLEEERLTYTFSSPLEVLRHLKKTGVTSLNGTPMSCTDLHAFIKEYVLRYGTTEGVSLTYHPIYVVARKKEQRKYANPPCYQIKRI